MRYLLYTVLFLFASTRCFSQSINYIEDSHLRAQNDRMVFKSWGNFKPKAKYFLGIQTNVHYTSTWGWLAPNQNKKYKEGKDIRPLGPVGQQTQRMLFLKQMRGVSDKYLKEAEVLGRTGESEFLYNIGLISKADPLWLLYYEKKLKPVLKWNIGGTNHSQTNDLGVLMYLNEQGITKWWGEEMDRLKQRLEGALDLNMERGSRILAYHRIMKEYESIQAIYNQHMYWAKSLLAIKKDSEKINTGKILKETNWRESQSDSEIMRGVIKEAIQY